MDRTGRALGTLNPIHYLQNANGHLILVPVEQKESGLADARRVYELKFKPQGYEWKEAGTLKEVQILQKRLVEQEQRILDGQGQADVNRRQRLHAEVAASLRQRMMSSSCSAYERDFIELWLNMREEKQDQYTQRFTERNMYIHALEFDSSSKPEDRIK